VECLFNLRSERLQSIGRGGFVLRSGKRGEIRIGDGGDLGEVGGIAGGLWEIHGRFQRYSKEI
jgi:hypothetical protein